MFKIFLQKRRIYNYIKRNKHNIKLVDVCNSIGPLYTIYTFKCDDIKIVLHRDLIVDDLKDTYAVSVNHVDIAGWYGYKLCRMLRNLLYNQQKEREYNKLRSIKLGYDND